MTRHTASTSSPKDHSTQEYNPGCGGYYPAPWCHGRQYEVSRRETLIHPSAWRDCMKSPQRRVKRLMLRRLIAAYTNALPRSHIGTSRSLCSSSCCGRSMKMSALLPIYEHSTRKDPLGKVFSYL